MVTSGRLPDEPGPSLPRRQPHVGASRHDRDAERRRRLHLTLPPVADVGFVRRTGEFVADSAALAAAGEPRSTSWSLHCVLSGTPAGATRAAGSSAWRSSSATSEPMR